MNAIAQHQPLADRFKASLNFNNLFDEEYFEFTYVDLSVYPSELFTVPGTVS